MTMLNLYPGAKVGGQQLIRRLRGGEDRQVFCAVDLSDQRQTVVKIASLGSPANAGRLEREFDVLREAAGPGVVASLGYGVALPQQLAWLILAPEGSSLAVVLAGVTEQRLPTDIALAAAHAAATSLGELHSRGWRHGDLKPGNLLCNADGTVILSDMEFASRLGDQPSGQRPGLGLAGTPPFVAPELWQAGASNPSMAADVWALGITLYLCIFGEYPFGHEGDLEIAAAIDRGLPKPLAELPKPLGALFASLLAHEPTRRPLDGHAAAKLVASTAEQLGVDLVTVRRTFGRLVAALPEEESPSEPATWTSAAFPADEAAAVEMLSVVCLPQRPTNVVTVKPLECRPKGVGGGTSAIEELLSPSRRTETLSRDLGLAPSSTQVARLDPKTEAVLAPMPAAVPPPTFVRRAAVRWYRRMNPQRNFPLSVVFSGKQIRIVGGSGLGITLGTQEIILDRSDPVLSVEPWFPGCLISPPRADVHVSEENTVCRFWVTPLADGDLSEACVTVRYRGKVVETLATPAKVVTRTLAKVLAVLGLVSPIASKALTIAGWNPDRLLRQSLPHAANLLAGIGPLRSGLCLAGVLLSAALLYFYVTRPLLCDEPEPSVLLQNA